MLPGSSRDSAWASDAGTGGRDPLSLVGEWVVEQVTRRGTPQGLAGCRWTFTADRTWTLRDENGILADRGRYTLGPDPGAVDLAATAAAERTLGRYRVEGDILVLSLGLDGGGRPADFEPGPKLTVWVLKRIKDK